LGKNARHAAIAILLMTAASSSAAAGALRITSPAFEHNAVMPPDVTCDGRGVSPPDLRFSGIPGGTTSLALIVFDPDVPRAIKSDGRFLHWALWDLPPDAGALVVRKGKRGLNENGPGGYIPACPPNGEHRYVFQLFALDTLIGKTRIASEADLRHAMEGHVLDQAELVGRYSTRAFRVVRVVVAAMILLVVYLIARRIVTRRRIKAALSD
jgi:Raf kinase inhibitor-like YbhB/YbcL family protein